MADLNALIAQGAQFHAPVDPFAQYAKMQQLQQGQQANMLNQMKMDEYQRGIAEQNALRGLYSSGLDQASPEFTSKLGAISPTAAQAHQKSMLEASKAKADIAKAQEDVRTSQNKALGQGLLIALKDPSDAGLDQAFSLLDAQKIDTKPFRAQFANITDPAQRKSLIQSYVTGTEEGRKALEFVQPKPEKIDLGGKLVTIDINPNSPTFKQQITEFAKTASPDAVLSSETTKRGQNLTDARAREQLAQGKVPAGYRLKADGSLEFIPGGPADPAAGGGKPLTEGQGNAVAFGMRMAEADKILENLAKAGTEKGTVVGGTPFIGESLSQNLPSWLGGSNESQQQYNQAKANFITAVLRKESGATIGDDEFAREEKKYFPQLNDGPKVIKQKAEARKLAIKAMKVQAGPGAASIEGGNGGWEVVK